MLTMRPGPHRAERAAGGAERCARQILEVVPRAMRLLREEMRSGIGLGLSVPQFRALAFLDRSPGASLSAAAAFLGVAGPTASTMVERLVRRGLVQRGDDPRERRRVRLELTRAGAVLLERARSRARASMAERLSALDGAELSALSGGLELLARALPAPADRGGRP
ncbi:MAG TPA: MarR family winged helix-turn-helix transcriptional regulator [Anaeromyxobacter sp.]|nr:MarR family winged helix-turn-helix transcriptional regulator [Anaeromyxobacter sp.]